MEPYPDAKKPWRMATVILSVLLILTVIGAGFGYYYYGKAKKDKESLQSQITELQKQLAEKTTSATSEKTTSTPTATSECASTLTEADKTETALWKTLTNSTYHYSFKYPETWTVSKNEAKVVVLTDSESQIEFAIRSAEMSALGYEGYNELNKKTIKVACQTATRVYLSEGTTSEVGKQNVILTTFTKSGTNHLISISFKYVGASISSDIVEAYDLILKTFAFK